VSGLLSASPLASREAQAALRMPVLDLAALGHPAIAEVLGVPLPVESALRAAG
jgi:hypothetical protein